MSKKRLQLIETAVELFNEHGFHGVGIDRIAEAAGVSKKTMYHHFRSKEELILAALRHHDGLFRNQFMKGVEAAADTPRERLLAIFDVAEAWFASNRFFGCLFINAVGEYAEPDTPIRGVCRQFKQLMRGYIEDLAREAGAPDAPALADALALLLEGAIVTAQVSGNPSAAESARQAAAVLIDHALSGSVIEA
ncbi:TetR/AcrR family transcriptional regulator [Elongatibacter sediminis]|uniref:TetR/AcrR family transcriptional regulator n=1 Tax=Elongatibacter sediminis TaxID=3119006 RepID=A0AAW9RE09_9GAMM